jgi:DNA polymerase I
MSDAPSPPAATILHPNYDPIEPLSESAYNCLDILVTARVQKIMESEGGLKPSLFDQALLGPSITCSMRGMRIDHSRIPEARAQVESEARKAQAALLAVVPSELKFGKSWKPSPQALARILYSGFKVRTRLGKTDSPSVAKDILTEILEDPRTPEAAVPVVELALQLSRLEEDRKALEKPAAPDGRIHSSFMVSSAISGRWGSRKDAFGLGMNLHSASDFIRSIFIADPGCILVSMDQCQAESNCVAFLSGSDWYINAHKAGNVHVEAGRVFFPEHANQDKKWMKTTPHPSNPGQTYYDMSKRLQHASNYMQTPNGIARHAHITQREARAAQGNYFRNMPEIPAYHHWVENEIRTKRRLVSPLGRVRQFLGRTWETTTVREAVSWQPQSCISDITKIFLWRLWRHLDPDRLQVLLEHHDSVLFQVREAELGEVMAQVLPLTNIPIPIGPRVLNSRWEVKVGPSWADMHDWP